MNKIGGGESSQQQQQQHLNKHKTRFLRNKKNATNYQLPLKAKVVMLGNMGVGKTSILLRHDGQGFTSKLSSTQGAFFICSRPKIHDGREVELQIWDTAGQERFRSMVPLYLRNTAAALIVFDITNRQSFKELNCWIKALEHNSEYNHILLFIIGNKSDLSGERKVTEIEAVQFAEEQNAKYFETSALNGRGIETAMQAIAENILLESEQQTCSSSHFGSSFNLEEEGIGGQENKFNNKNYVNKEENYRKKEEGNNHAFGLVRCCSIL
ncbi:hypothetical protein Mgra_00006669 [Meloidogyne graminicola]|uniref:Uncharacterized protein n=1 Tax=Meloidogyne graminicola TaxID=189291 RepID=A0A8S9ZKW4_9BILA|nr:hypothetical protein Mgra_00006669 [Meloidogyne graminicola]